ncbi:hypothetical protein PYW08_008465 [Mythimna loreyi]|uniref:Uncharacterized protein n=1 Tax=Mythimna loreyi TaxID=667449 RepID=A0ACC2QBK6_9NEOP|nr:hypothetical protein PYW08_008465 [Mythimna loreyi]
MSETDEKKSEEKFEWIYFLRQLFICSGSWSCFFMLGLCTGTPTVLVPQLRREANSTDAVSPEMASWLPAMFSYAGIPWIIILPALIHLVGRKITQNIVCISSFIGFIIFYNSKDVFIVLISEIFQGAVTASYLTIAMAERIKYDFC